MAPSASSAPTGASLARRHLVAAAVLLLGFAAVALLLAWFFAASPLTAVEPNAEFIDCGPALIGRPSPLPDPSCADAYGFVQLLSLFLGLAGAASLIGSAWLLARANGRRLRLR